MTSALDSSLQKDSYFALKKIDYEYCENGQFTGDDRVSIRRTINLRGVSNLIYKFDREQFMEELNEGLEEKLAEIEQARI